MTSHEALGEWLSNGDDGRIARVSAGTLKHEETSWCAFEEIFKWFLAAEEDDEPIEMRQFELCALFTSTCV